MRDRARRVHAALHWAGGIIAAVACGTNGGLHAIDGGTDGAERAEGSADREVPSEAASAEDGSEAESAAGGGDADNESMTGSGCVFPLKVTMMTIGGSGPPSAAAYFVLTPDGTSCALRRGTDYGSSTALQFLWSNDVGSGSVHVPSGSPWQMISLSDGLDGGLLFTPTDASPVPGDTDLMFVLGDAQGSASLTFRIDSSSLSLTLEHGAFSPVGPGADASGP